MSQKRRNGPLVLNRRAPDLLKVYLRTWYQYHCPDPRGMTKDDKKRSLRLHKVVNYWLDVTPRFYFDTPTEHNMRLCALSWPRCFYCVHYSYSDGYVTGLDFDELHRDYPNFRGCVRVECLRLDRYLENIPISVRCFDMDGCDRLTDSAFQYLSNLRSLDIGWCSESTITDSAFQHLSNLTSLYMEGCYQWSITDSAFQHLSNLRSLNMYFCHQSTITDFAFKHLSNLTSLYMARCCQDTITDSAFRHVSGLLRLDIRDCFQSTITDSAFQHLSKLMLLNMEFCPRWSVITGSGFKHLSNLTSLTIEGSPIPDSALQLLPNLQWLNTEWRHTTTFSARRTRRSLANPRYKQSGLRAY